MICDLLKVSTRKYGRSFLLPEELNIMKEFIENMHTCESSSDNPSYFLFQPS